MNQHRLWTAAEVDTLRRLYPDLPAREIAQRLGIELRRVQYKANRLGLRKSLETIARLSQQAMQNPAHPGRLHQFKPGQKPWNQGTHFIAGGRSCAFR